MDVWYSIGILRDELSALRKWIREKKYVDEDHKRLTLAEIEDLSIAIGVLDSCSEGEFPSRMITRYHEIDKVFPKGKGLQAMIRVANSSGYAKIGREGLKLILFEGHALNVDCDRGVNDPEWYQCVYFSIVKDYYNSYYAEGKY